MCGVADSSDVARTAVGRMHLSGQAFNRMGWAGSWQTCIKRCRVSCASVRTLREGGSLSRAFQENSCGCDTTGNRSRFTWHKPGFVSGQSTGKVRNTMCYRVATGECTTFAEFTSTGHWHLRSTHPPRCYTGARFHAGTIATSPINTSLRTITHDGCQRYLTDTFASSCNLLIRCDDSI